MTGTPMFLQGDRLLLPGAVIHLPEGRWEPLIDSETQSPLIFPPNIFRSWEKIFGANVSWKDVFWTQDPQTGRWAAFHPSGNHVMAATFGRDGTLQFHRLLHAEGWIRPRASPDGRILFHGRWISFDLQEEIDDRLVVGGVLPGPERQILHGGLVLGKGKMRPVPGLETLAVHDGILLGERAIAVAKGLLILANLASGKAARIPAKGCVIHPSGVWCGVSNGQLLLGDAEGVRASIRLDISPWHLEIARFGDRVFVLSIGSGRPGFDAVLLEWDLESGAVTIRNAIIPATGVRRAGSLLILEGPSGASVLAPDGTALSFGIHRADLAADVGGMEVAFLSGPVFGRYGGTLVMRVRGEQRVLRLRHCVPINVRLEGFRKEETLRPCVAVGKAGVLCALEDSPGLTLIRPDGREIPIRFPSDLEDDPMLTLPVPAGFLAMMAVRGGRKIRVYLIGPDGGKEFQQDIARRPRRDIADDILLRKDDSGIWLVVGEESPILFSEDR